MLERRSLDSNDLRPIQSEPGYFADSEGNIISAKPGRFNRTSGRLQCLKKQSDKDGNQTTVLYQVHCGRRNKRVSALVAEAFHGPRPVGLVIAHLNGDKTDDRPENLAYVSQSENMLHKRAHGTAQRGERARLAKLKEPQVREIIDRLHGGESGAALGRAFGVGNATISAIRLGRTWAHLPRPWERFDAGISAGLVM